MSQSIFFGPHTDSCLVWQTILFPVCMCHGQLCQEHLKRRSGHAYLNTSMIRRAQSFFFGLIQTLAFSDRPFIWSRVYVSGAVEWEYTIARLWVWGAGWDGPENGVRIACFDITEQTSWKQVSSSLLQTLTPLEKRHSFSRTRAVREKKNHADVLNRMYTNLWLLLVCLFFY